MRLKQVLFLILVLSGALSAKADLIESIWDINDLIYGVVAGVAALMIALHAIRWKTADGPSEREAAKRGIINVIIGLVIIMLAIYVVELIYLPGGQARGINCDSRDGWYKLKSLGPACLGSKLCNNAVEKGYRDYSKNAGGCSFREAGVKIDCDGTLLDCPAGQVCQNGRCIAGNTPSTSTTVTTTTTPLGGCNRCQDGTVCSEANGLKQVCECEDYDKDGKYDSCRLNDIGLCTKTCHERAYDYAECQYDPQNPNFICNFRETYIGDGYCPSTQGNPSHCCCGSNAPNSTCKDCFEGTPCGGVNKDGYECVCRQEPRWWYRECHLLYLCQECNDGTKCGEVNPAGMECKCEYSGMRNMDKKCFLDPACAKCADGTPCGQTNANGELCDCTRELLPAVYGDCDIRKTCEKCYDGTPCGQTNQRGEICTCDPYKGGKSVVCSLYGTCDKCSDGTLCGQTNGKGEVCDCIKQLANGRYWICGLNPTCAQCSDGTACGQTNDRTRKCDCLYPVGSGRFELCVQGCEKCYDGTACGQENQRKEPCQCFDRIGTSSVYDVCELDSKEPPKDGRCQTYKDCYEQLGLCWVCPDPGGTCKYASGDREYCPDCHSFGEDFACQGGIYHRKPYCCFRFLPKEDNLEGSTCSDGTPVGSCSTPNTGLRCYGPPNQLKPDPSCGIECSDSDGGRDVNKKGSCTDAVTYYSTLINMNNYIDHCVKSDAVFEVYCSGNACISEEITCPAGYHCYDGLCRK